MGEDCHTERVEFFTLENGFEISEESGVSFEIGGSEEFEEKEGEEEEVTEVVGEDLEFEVTEATAVCIKRTF